MDSRNYKLWASFVSAIAVAMIAGLFVFGFSAVKRVNQINDNWSVYSEKDATVNHALSRLKGAIGYGGLIHNFKNYVLRHDAAYKARAESNIAEILAVADGLSKYLEVEEERKALKAIKNVVLTYKEMLVKTGEMAVEGHTAWEIDSTVKIHDKPALDAFAYLLELSESRSDQMRAQADFELQSTVKFLSFGIFVALGVAGTAVLILLFIRKIAAANAAVTQACARIDLLFDSAPDPMISVRPDGSIAKYNAQAETFFGYTQAEVARMTVEDFMPEKYREKHKAYRAKYTQSPKYRTIGAGLELIAQTKDGRQPLTEISLSHSGEGDDALTTITVRDITERKQIEEELKTMREQAEKIVEGAPDAIISVDADQNIIAFNTSAEVIFGYVKDEALGEPLGLLLPKNVTQKHVKLVHQFGSSKPEARRMWERRELCARRKNGELFPADISISKQDTSAGLIFTAILKDISGAQQAENALRESEERFRALANHTPNKLHIKDTEGRYILINRKSEELFGITNEEAKGKTAADIFPSEVGEVFDAHSRAVIETGEPIEAEEEFLLDDGVHTYLTVKFPILGADGDIVAVGSSGFEITERKRAEEELIRHRDHLEELVNDRTAEVKEKAAQLEDALAREKEYNVLQQKFVALVSHEFRTPLSIIDGMAQRLIRSKDKLSLDEVVTRANKVRSAVTRMIGLIDTTLYASRLDAGKIDMKIVPFDIGELLLDVSESQSEISPSHQIRTTIDDLPGEIFADRRLLYQVFSNLLSNAVKYAPYAPLIEVQGWMAGSNVLVSVTDNGVGIPESDLPQIFQRFFRAKTADGIKGTGIGLNVVKEFVQLHGGSVGVDSLEGEGSTFTVRLPINGAGQ